MAFSPLAVQADEVIRCESNDYRYRTCALSDHGYVRLHRQISSTACRQGQNWDYDRRAIWVDDGCAAEFIVEDRYHTSKDKNHDGEKAIAAVAAIALLGAVAAANHKDEDKYDHDGYGRGGHSSHIPSWMVGEFRGYNTDRHADVRMHIGSDGRVEAHTGGVDLRGYVNDQRLYVGNAQFEIERAGDGFNTVQVGDRRNRVHYSRR